MLPTPQSCLQALKSYRYGDMHEEAFEEQEMLGQIMNGWINWRKTKTPLVESEQVKAIDWELTDEMLGGAMWLRMIYFPKNGRGLNKSHNLQNQ